MNSTQSNSLRELLRSQPIAALGTLHGTQPFVSMVPFAVLPDGEGLVIHVSALASHTQDMLASADVSLMIMAPPDPGIMPHATARVTIQGRAEQCTHASDDYAQAKSSYLSRFPQAADLFSLGDFSLFVIRPVSARFVGGFAQALTISGEALSSVLAGTQVP